ncbi:post-transcriptional regulator MKT1L-like [Anopheles ziemanni]|uniref:post-transcriptional regulator MKT1L-like n=1 Tax=Anopheles ziemanni TaxID=345580 RepID=UPI00265F0252|nr:post-transcriptional regulator MKT1L-like [Anopheles ziemanni]
MVKLSLASNHKRSTITHESNAQMSRERTDLPVPVSPVAAASGGAGSAGIGDDGTHHGIYYYHPRHDCQSHSLEHSYDSEHKAHSTKQQQQQQPHHHNNHYATYHYSGGKSGSYHHPHHHPYSYTNGGGGGGGAASSGQTGNAKSRGPAKTSHAKRPPNDYERPGPGGGGGDSSPGALDPTPPPHYGGKSGGKSRKLSCELFAEPVSGGYGYGEPKHKHTKSKSQSQMLLLPTPTGTLTNTTTLPAHMATAPATSLPRSTTAGASDPALSADSRQSTPTSPSPPPLPPLPLGGHHGGGTKQAPSVQNAKQTSPAPSPSIGRRYQANNNNTNKSHNSTAHLHQAPPPTAATAPQQQQQQPQQHYTKKHTQKHQQQSPVNNSGSTGHGSSRAS